MNTNKHWYLIAQRAGARIFEQEGIKSELHLIRRFENPEGRLRTNELVSDRQGRSDSSGSAGHIAVGGDDAQRNHVLDTFAHKLGSFLESEAEHNSFMSLVLVAEPHVLGVLKSAMGTGTSRLLRDSLAKDLIHVSDHDMAAHLVGTLCVREAII